METRYQPVTVNPHDALRRRKEAEAILSFGLPLVAVSRDGKGPVFDYLGNISGPTFIARSPEDLNQLDVGFPFTDGWRLAVPIQVKSPYIAIVGPVETSPYEDPGSARTLAITSGCQATWFFQPPERLTPLRVPFRALLPRTWIVIPPTGAAYVPGCDPGRLIRLGHLPRNLIIEN